MASAASASASIIELTELRLIDDHNIVYNIYCTEQIKRTCSEVAQMKYVKPPRPIAEYQKENRKQKFESTDFSGVLAKMILNKISQEYNPTKSSAYMKLDYLQSINIWKSLGMWETPVQAPVVVPLVEAEEMVSLPEGTPNVPAGPEPPKPITDSKASENEGWSYNKTVLLIELYREHCPEFKSPVIKKKDVWSRIAEKMRERGYIITGEIADKKWRALVFRYKSIRDNQKKTGQGRKKWEFYDRMDEILAGDPSVRPAFTISSLEGVTQTETEKKTLQAPAEKTKEKKQRKTQPPAWLDEIIKAQTAQVDRLEAVAQQYNDVQRERNNLLKALLDKMV